MLGIVHYDFGDAIRTTCNTAAEDETNLDLVEFNMDYYNAYTEGFLKKMKHFLSPIELEYLPLSAKNDDIHNGIAVSNRLFKRRCVL